MQTKGWWVLAGLLAANAAYACPACGDKLNFGGMNFERTNPNPGRVVVLVSPGSTVSAGKLDIKAALERDGHQVFVAQSPEELDRLSHDHQADVVVTHWSDVPVAEQKLGTEPGAPTIVPVAYEDKDAAAAKAEGADRCLARADQKRGRKLAEAIDKILEQRRKGAPSECVATVANRSD
jgi:hypothetical protein